MSKLVRFFLVKKYLFLICLFLLIGCVDFLPKEVQFTHTQLQSWVQRRFPLEKKQSLLATEVYVRLDRPILTLDAEHQKVRLAANVQITVDTQVIRSGSITVSGRLSFDRIRHALILRNATIEEFQVEEAPLGILPFVGSTWLKELGDISIYTLPAEKIKRFGQAFDNAAITIFPESVVIKR